MDDAPSSAQSRSSAIGFNISTVGKLMGAKRCFSMGLLGSVISERLSAFFSMIIRYLQGSDAP